MKSVRRYIPSDLQAWNEFVANAKNASFLFNRNYMDYHAYRFRDHSLLAFENEKLAAVFVASEKGTAIISHEGLTYGGLALGNNAKLEDVLGYFYHIVRYYHDLGFTEIVYKCFPYFLTRYPSQEDLYALFLLKASLIRRDSSCVLVSSQALPYQHGRKSAVAYAQKQNYVIRRASDPSEFWKRVLIPNLTDKFGVQPTHTAEEMQLLMSRFPHNIHLYEISGDELLGGTVVFETPTSIHTQYISATPAGKERGALDLLLHELISNTYADKNYISFGMSNEQNGIVLNRGLMSWKEGFGARTATLDFYAIQTSQYQALSSYA